MSRITCGRVVRWLGALLLAQGCASDRVQVQVPPRVDLAAWPMIGIVEFHGVAEPELASLATSQFVQMLLAAQPGTRILELGSERRVLAEVGHSELDFSAARAIGEHFGVDAIFTGALVLGAPKPSVLLGQSFESIDARAGVGGRLDVRLLEARSGASVWSGSATASAPVARLGVAEGIGTSFGVSDPRDAYTVVVRLLAQEQRYDFHPTWHEE